MCAILVHFWKTKHRSLCFSWLHMICFLFKLQAACHFADGINIPILSSLFKDKQTLMWSFTSMQRNSKWHWGQRCAADGAAVRLQVRALSPQSRWEGGEDSGSWDLLQSRAVQAQYTDSSDLEGSRMASQRRQHLSLALKGKQEFSIGEGRRERPPRKREQS